MWRHHSRFCLCLPMAIFPVRLCLHAAFLLSVWIHVQSPLFWLGCQSHWSRAHPTDLILAWYHLQRPYFLTRPHSQGLEVRTSTCLFEENCSTRNTAPCENARHNVLTEQWPCPRCLPLLSTNRNLGHTLSLSSWAWQRIWAKLMLPR